jgi:hypothetical protein
VSYVKLVQFRFPDHEAFKCMVYAQAGVKCMYVSDIICPVQFTDGMRYLTAGIDRLQQAIHSIVEIGELDKF